MKSEGRRDALQPQTGTIAVKETTTRATKSR